MYEILFAETYPRVSLLSWCMMLLLPLRICPAPHGGRWRGCWALGETSQSTSSGGAGAGACQQSLRRVHVCRLGSEALLVQLLNCCLDAGVKLYWILIPNSVDQRILKLSLLFMEDGYCLLTALQCN